MSITNHLLKLLVVGALWIEASSSSADQDRRYNFFNNELPWKDADKECKNRGGHLARIWHPVCLNKTKSAYQPQASGRALKHWTDLKYNTSFGSFEEWRWSDGTYQRPDSNLTSIANSPWDTKCFLITDADILQEATCTEHHAYVCDLPKLSATSKQSVSPSPTPTKVTFIPTVAMTTLLSTSSSAARTITTNTAVIPGTTRVAASKTYTPTPVQTLTPTITTTAENQINRYLIRIKALKVNERTSLQVAVNETSQLLTGFEEGAFDRNGANVLVAAQELEKFGILYARRHLNANNSSINSILESGKQIEIKLQKVKADDEEAVIISSDKDGGSSSFDGKDRITLPARLFRGQERSVVSIIYKDIHLLVPEGGNNLLNGKKLKEGKLQTRVISCSIYPRPSHVLEENVTISFNRTKEVVEEYELHCVFWDFNFNSKYNGSWSSKGCFMVEKTNSSIICSCNHLTHFAVLMQVGEKKIDAKHKMALQVITYIGCGLSLLGEFLTVLAYLLLMNLKQEQSQIRLNLVVTIAIAQIVFLSGIEATAHKGACVFVAVSIHYFYLVGFSWMLMEGVYLYLMVVKVFNTVVKMKLFYAFCWGFPLLMVVTSIVIASNSEGDVMSYVHSDFCWVSFTNNLVWTFAAPVLVVCLINSVILGRVVCEMTRMQAAKASDISNVKQGLKACAVLFPLLGMTWVFGILSVTDAGLVFQYLFTILNSLQGFFIFVIHVLRSSDVRAAYQRKKHKWELTKNSNLPSSRSTFEPSSVFSDKHAMNKMTSTEGLDVISRRNQVSPIGINQERMDTRESCLTPVA